MPTSQRRRDQGAHHARYLLPQLGSELRTARLSAGLSQVRLGEAIGVSGTHIARLERAAVPGASLTTFTVVFAVLGMRLSARPYPQGPPLRDAAHVRLLARFRARLPATARMRTEVPLRRGRDLRAWDAEVEVVGGSVKVEAETALHDLQATDRKIALKMEDHGVDHVVLLVARTRRNAHVLREHRELLWARYPLDTRTVLHALRHGQRIQQSGIAVL